MNWEIFWTTIAIFTAGIFILPFYLAMFIAYDKSRAKTQLEFIATAEQIGKKVKFDSEVERLFEEGDAI
jgi:hypothetical protein